MKKYNINYSINDKYDNNSKIKYVENKIIDKNIQKNNKKIDTESFLKINNYNNKKSQVSLKKIGNDNFLYYENNYNQNYHINSNNKQANRWDGTHFGPGKGFGNLDINNQIRNSSNSRLNNEDFKSNREGLINNRFEVINRPYNPENVLFPFRNGKDTRKDKPSKNSEKNDFIFRY